MKLLLIFTSLILFTLNSYSHCSGCGVGEDKRKHTHSSTQVNGSDNSNCTDKYKNDYKSLDLSQKYDGSSIEFDALMAKYIKDIKKINKKYELKFKKLSN